MSEGDRSQPVSLGCGTLILICLIVLIFSGGQSEELEKELRNLRQEIVTLNTTVNNQTMEISKLQEEVIKLGQEAQN